MYDDLIDAIDQACSKGYISIEEAKVYIKKFLDSCIDVKENENSATDQKL